MTKEEKIKEAYGSYYEEVKNKIDNNGWLFDSLDFFNEKMTNIDIDHKWHNEYEASSYRPLQLEGIENNNGWIKIESEADLPKENGVYWTLRNGSTVPLYLKVYNDLDSEYWVNAYTHYQKIIKPEPPLY